MKGPFDRILKLEPKDIFKIIGLFYLLFLNSFVVKVSPEIIFIELLLFNLLLNKISNKTFIKDWALMLVGLICYEFLRGYADNYSPFYNQLLYVIALYEVNNAFLMQTTQVLKQVFLSNSILLNLCVFFYSVYFFYTFIVGYFIWVRHRDRFSLFKYRFLLLTYIGLLFYFFVPTAPPWFYYSNEAHRAIFGETIYGNFTFISIYRYFVYSNPVAAYPSLHVAWTAFTSAFLVRELGKKYLFAFVIPIMVGISVVITDEHWIIDVLVGLFLGISINYIFSKQRLNNADS